jgi:hypothetical protein
MDPNWDSYEDDVGTSDLLGELDRIRNKWKHRSVLRRPLKRGSKIAMTVVSVTVAMGIVAAVALFAHVITFVSAAKITTNCAAPTGAVSGSLIVFSCGSPPTIGVSSGSSGTVGYSAFGTLPGSITSVYLIDVQATVGSTCAATTGSGVEPVGPLTPASGGSLTISNVAGNLRPGHNYNYCMDFSTLPPSFTSAVTWSQ